MFSSGSLRGGLYDFHFELTMLDTLAVSRASKKGERKENGADRQFFCLFCSFEGNTSAYISCVFTPCPATRRVLSLCFDVDQKVCCRD